MSISNSTFAYNAGAAAGEISQNANYGTCVIENSTFTKNHADLGAGISGGGITIVNSTIVENEADTRGGGIYANNGNITLVNTLVAGNISPDGPDIKVTSGSLTSLGSNFISVADGLTLHASDLSGTSSSPLDPKLRPFGDYGGPTATYIAKCHSPLLDAGNNAFAPAYDQRGLARIQRGTIDIGATESLLAAIGLNAIVTDVTMPGASDGAIDLSVIGGVAPFEFIWSTYDTTEDISGLSSDLYAVYVEDSAGCFRFGIYEVGEPDACEDIDTVFVTNINETSAYLQWNVDSNAYSYLLRGRISGKTNWTYIQVVPGSVAGRVVYGLEAGNDYEWQVQKFCDPDEIIFSQWTALDYFSTRCEAPAQTLTDQITANSARLRWLEVADVSGYDSYIRESGTSSWYKIQRPAGTDSKFIGGLQSATSYEWKIRSICDTSGEQSSKFTALESFTTLSGSRITSDNLWDANIRVYPNPFDEKLRIEIPFDYDQQSIMHVYSANGQLLHVDELQSGSTYEWQTVDLPGGVYLIEIRSDSQVEHFKMIKE